MFLFSKIRELKLKTNIKNMDLNDKEAIVLLLDGLDSRSFYNINRKNMNIDIDKDKIKKLIDNIDGNVQENCNKFAAKHCYYKNVLELAVSTNSVEFVNMFVTDFKFDPSIEKYDGMQLLHIAIAHDSYDMVEYLLKFIKDINLKYRDYFEYDEVGNSHHDVLTILHVAKIKTDPNTDIIELLIENGARL